MAGRLGGHPPPAINSEQSLIHVVSGESFHPAAISEFLKEATIMKDFDHENVLKLVGVVIEEHCVYVVGIMMRHLQKLFVRCHIGLQKNRDQTRKQPLTFEITYI